MVQCCQQWAESGAHIASCGPELVHICRTCTEAGPVWPTLQGSRFADIAPKVFHVHQKWMEPSPVLSTLNRIWPGWAKLAFGHGSCLSFLDRTCSVDCSGFVKSGPGLAHDSQTWNEIGPRWPTFGRHWTSFAKTGPKRVPKLVQSLDYTWSGSSTTGGKLVQRCQTGPKLSQCAKSGQTLGPRKHNDNRTCTNGSSRSSSPGTVVV